MVKIMSQWKEMKEGNGYAVVFVRKRKGKNIINMNGGNLFKQIQ